MIYASTTGRLGNILFTVAAVNSLAIDNNDTIGIVKNKNTSAVTKYKHNVLSNYLFVDYPSVSNVSKEFIYSSNTIYHNYFQSEKYFKHNKEAIIKSFKFPEVDNIYDNFVSVHIRRTDYVRTGTANESLSVDYYNRAMKLFPNARFVFFSDDISYVKHQFPGYIYVESGDELTELSIMAKASNSIIANSSFSWWGAYLGNPSRVIAPDIWFVPDTPIDEYITDNMIVIHR